MTKKELELVKEAMVVLEGASIGAIGEDGATLEEMEQAWEEGHPMYDDSYYDTCQHAWLLLSRAAGQH